MSNPFEELRELVLELRESNRLSAANAYLQREILVEVRHTNRLLWSILSVEDHPPTDATFLPENPMLPFAPGTTGIKFLTTLLPAGFTQPTSVEFSYASSDSNVSIAADPSDATGATALVSIADAESVGTSFKLTATITGVNASGSPINISKEFDGVIVSSTAGDVDVVDADFKQTV